MNDIVNIRLSKDANDIAERLVATGKFENVVTAAKFALSYALKNHFDECDPSTYSIPDSSGSNYNVGSFDNDDIDSSNPLWSNSLDKDVGTLTCK